MVPVLNVFMDNRDHRKITVIDGIVGFTGGYNLADEYFDIVKPYGHWKDTGVKITGNAVKNLTITFLEIWNAINSKDVDDMKYSKFLPDACKLIKQDETLRRKWLNSDKGYIQPYADSPLDMEHVGENVYLNVIASANKYIYFMTPYLIIDTLDCVKNCDISELFNNLCIINNLDKNKDKNEIEKNEKLSTKIISEILSGNLNELLNSIVLNDQSSIGFEEGNTYHQISTLSKNIDDSKNNYTSVYFGYCEEYLRNEYDIGDDEQLIIYQNRQY